MNNKGYIGVLILILFLFITLYIGGYRFDNFSFSINMLKMLIIYICNGCIKIFVFIINSLSSK